MNLSVGQRMNKIRRFGIFVWHKRLRSKTARTLMFNLPIWGWCKKVWVIARAAAARFLKFCYEARKERRRIQCGDISLYILCGVCLFFSKTAVHAKEASRAVIWMAKDGKNTHLCIESQSFRFRQDSAGVAWKVPTFTGLWSTLTWKKLPRC